MVQRIEVIERYEYIDPQAQSEAEVMGKEPEFTIGYRRIFPRLNDIAMPIEIPGKKRHCRLEFNDGSIITIRENFDDFCIRLNDLENGQVEEGITED